MIKKIVKAAVVLLIFALQPEILAQTTWHNPEEAGFHVLQGRRYNGEARERFYHRFPAKAKETVRKAVWSQSVDAAGESIVFTTDANEITVRYTVNKRHAMPHMPATGVTGVDLYTTDRNGDEIWLAGKYSFKDTVVFSYKEIDIEKKPKAHRYTLFLPLYNEVKWMEIGTNEGAEFRFEPIPEEKPIVAYGTSICHGACASRPGMAWTNILQRRLGHEVVNLGFSGNAKLETEVMDLISQIDAKVYIIDDAELERVKNNYPVIWKDKNAKPKLCFIGCPHLSLQQLIDWTVNVEDSLKAAGNQKVLIPTVFTTAPGVKKEFEQTEYAQRLKDTGVILSCICPLMYMNNPLCGKMPVITCSNKLRTYTSSRFYSEDEILVKITKGGK